ncbi:hypothetical protein EWM64_g4680 [Hericium alpestre]|uniref:Alkyl transferase n=1 Tax=Hericium alpestre TaxID=135208 RepID=A0A4Y9ZYR2_9AGAM|nr:hypothetical protein EWM64_g4680 [Hericium alpestre]
MTPSTNAYNSSCSVPSMVNPVRRAVRWLRGFVLHYLQHLLIFILASGPIPKHVAFVMDGNRRYARKRAMLPQQGHSHGYVAFRRNLEICFRLKVKCVSAYVFSIDNFKRSPEEVDALMTLAEQSFSELIQYGNILQQYGVRLNVVGKKEMLPENVLKAVRKAEDMTRHNNKAILNLCMPYTSRDEITTAVRDTVHDSLQADQPLEITEKDIDDHLMTTKGGSPPLDILIRTSGVKRLSDFLLWQCAEDTQIQIVDTYWPDFGLFDLLPIILDYQRKVWA